MKIVKLIKDIFSNNVNEDKLTELKVIRTHMELTGSMFLQEKMLVANMFSLADGKWYIYQLPEGNYISHCDAFYRLDTKACQKLILKRFPKAKRVGLMKALEKEHLNYLDSDDYKDHPSTPTDFRYFDFAKYFLSYENKLTEESGYAASLINEFLTGEFSYNKAITVKTSLYDDARLVKITLTSETSDVDNKKEISVISKITADRIEVYFENHGIETDCKLHTDANRIMQLVKGEIK